MSDASELEGLANMIQYEIDLYNKARPAADPGSNVYLRRSDVETIREASAKLARLEGLERAAREYTAAYKQRGGWFGVPPENEDTRLEEAALAYASENGE